MKSMKTFKTLLATALLATSTSTVVFANTVEQQLQQGIAAYKKDDYRTAFNLWKPLAEQGNALAQTLIGTMYDAGKGVTQDYAQAAKWYQQAAEQGHAKAQGMLGAMYGLGEGVPQDMTKAKMWIGRACDNGDQQACEFYRKRFNGGK